ncbi:glycosyltransferase family 9 protein [Paenimyroides viscosum]|nr:glycosyltransferase family 9 protein [Paenimyroides viscosum]HLV52328.1 glycosyltransferase family 9 protein [Flavobacterium sp.]
MKHILVIRLSAMGDVAMTVPVIRSLIQQHNDVKVTVVSRPFFKPFFDDMDRVDFFEVDLEDRHKGFFGIYRLYKDLKKLKIDFVADFHNVLRSKILRTFFKSNGTKTAFTDKGRKEKKELTRLEKKVLKPVKSMVDRHVDTLAQLGFKVDLSKISFPEKPVLSDEILAVTAKKSNNKWIGIAPFAQYQTKVYPTELMQKVILDLSENQNHKIFLFGGKNELNSLKNLQQNLENVILVADKLTFKQELQFIPHLDVMLSMDSGNAHIAVMYGVSVVTLWGNTHPFAGFVPFNQPLENSLIPDLEKYPFLPTSVYGNKIVTGYQDVMQSITPEEVVAKISTNLYE